MIHLGNLEKKVLMMKTNGMTNNIIEERLNLQGGQVKEIMNHISTRINTVSDTIHIQKIINSFPKPVMIDYTNFTLNGKPLTQYDIWSIMCNYNARNPKDKAFGKVINIAEKILEKEK